MKAKKIIYLLSTLMVMGLGGCTKEMSVPTPDFNVAGYEVRSTVDDEGNPSNVVTFQLSGNAYVITFYPGIGTNDKPVILKKYIDEPLRSYEFEYPAPGTYKVGFVAANVNPDDSKTVVKEMEVIIPE